jgi:SSS family solute:Na+ symporter
MTLFQRIYASKDLKSAKKAWYLAGVLEYPFMAILGVVLGLFARVGVEIGLYEAVGGSIANMDPRNGITYIS